MIRWTAVLSSVALAVGITAAAAPAPAPADAWVGTWGASITFPIGAEFGGSTLREFVRVSAGGSQVRARFSNETGLYPLVIGSAHVANPAADAASGAIDAGSDHALSFAGAPGATVAPGAAILSDPVDMTVGALATLAISVYVMRWTGPSVVHLDGNATTYFSAAGDFTAAPSFIPDHTSTSRFYLDQIDVKATGAAATLVAFGDSITDGYRSGVDANHRWPDRLAERLSARAHVPAVGVVNAGIGGNRILHDHPQDLFGPQALARLDRDVLSVPGLRWVVLLEGINDIGGPGSAGLPEQTVTAEQVIAGMRQIIDRVHDRGARIYGGTLTPFEGTTFPGYFKPDGELKRQAVNRWIRSGPFDAVIDFDAAVRDPEHPARLRAEWDVGDHLHPNDAGYRAMGDAVDLKLFD